MKYRPRRSVEPRGACCGSVDYTRWAKNYPDQIASIEDIGGPVYPAKQTDRDAHLPRRVNSVSLFVHLLEFNLSRTAGDFEVNVQPLDDPV